MVVGGGGGGGEFCACEVVGKEFCASELILKGSYKSMKGNSFYESLTKCLVTIWPQR